MDEKLLRFRHIAQQTIEQLDQANQNLLQDEEINNEKGTFKYYVSKQGWWMGYAKCLLLLTR